MNLIKIINIVCNTLQYLSNIVTESDFVYIYNESYVCQVALFLSQALLKKNEFRLIRRKTFEKANTCKKQKEKEGTRIYLVIIFDKFIYFVAFIKVNSKISISLKKKVKNVSIMCIVLEPF